MESRMTKCNPKQRQTLMKFILSILCANCICLVAGKNITMSSRNARTSFPNSKYVTFNTLNDRIGIDLDLSIPFLSIPLEATHGSAQPLVNINAKALTIAGIFTVVSTILVPLLIKSPAGPHYRLDDADQDWWNYGQTVNQMLQGNSYLAPCAKKLICSVVSNAYHTEGQSSLEKIIDGISSFEWLNQMMEGSAIQEAVAAGRESKDNCNFVYSGCFLPKKFFVSLSDPTFT